ncbi:MAG: UMP kinase [Deltaproteobacteria bacterium]|nr:UMP kinase [Deltaproteobacteria bacterium]
MARPYKRVLLKLSGEALEGPGGAVDPQTLDRVAQEVITARQAGAQIAIVIGGGNLFRGLTGAASGMDRTAADTMGMLATVMNCVALQDAFVRAGQAAPVLSAIPVMQVCDPFTRRGAVASLEAGEVVLLAGGTGNPYFTTDTAAALRALEIGAEALLKATKVDGIYDKDPVVHADAKRFAEITYHEVIERQLKVMDLTAVTLCRDNALPLVVFKMTDGGNIGRVLAGEDVGSRVIEANS